MREMKNSGVSWIGDIPKEWEIRRSKFCVTTRQNGNWGGEEGTSELDSICVRAADFDYEHLDFNHPSTMTKRSYSNLQFNKYKLQPLDLVVEKSGGGEKTPVGRAVLYEGGFSATYSNFMERIRVNPNVSLPRFFLYWWTANYQARWFVPYFNQTTGIQNLNTFDILNEARIPLPPLDEQRRVVSYLDERCAAIDEDVAKRREVIGKLKEYKKSLIAHAVTKGLDPTAEMKDSGIGWAGRIPSSWSRCKLKSLFQIKKRIAGVDGLTVLSITQDGIKPKDFSTGKGQFAESYSHYQLVHPGDFAMNHMDLLTGWVDISRYEGVTSPDYRVFSIRNHETCHPRYFLYLFQMCYLNRIFFGSANGIADKGRMRLQTASFKDFLVPWPAFDEQARISSFLDERCAVIDEAIARQEQLIDKLGEYRKSIIHHAVTGKIDCTEG